MDYTNERKPSDSEYQRDGAAEGGDVNTFRDDRREYSRGGQGRRGRALESDNWRSFPPSGEGGEGGDFRGGRGGYRGAGEGGRGGRGGSRGGSRGGRGGSYNAWTDRDATEDDHGSAPATAPESATVTAPRSAPEAEAGAPAQQEDREAGGNRWSREDDRGYGGRGGGRGYRGGGGGDRGYSRGGGRGGRRYYDAEDESGGYNARRGDDDHADTGEGGTEGGYGRGGYGRGGHGGGGYGGRGGRGGRRSYDDENDGGYNNNGGEGDNEGGYGGGYRRGGRGGGRGGGGRDYDYDRPRGGGRGGERGRGRDFRSFRDGADDRAEETGAAPQQQQRERQQQQQENAWASSPEPATSAPAPRSVQAPGSNVAPTQPAQPTAASLFAPPAAPKAEPAADWEEAAAPAQQYQQHSAIRRVTRAPHLRRNCHDEAKVMELFQHHHRQTGISLDNYDSIPVEMVPRDIKPVEDFSDLLVDPLLAENIERCGYKRPTPVQRYGIPVALSGNDLMACAQTGSGKTAAFLIPVVQHVLVHGVSPQRNRKSYPIALVLAPTRELAVQIFDEVRKLTFNTDIFYDVVYGGTRYPHRFEQDVLVACPGRLRDMFNEEYLSFASIKFLILDEADRMLEMGFEEQIEELVASRYTDMPTVDDRQTFMFSATFPQRILNLAKRYLRRKYYLLTVGRVGSTTKNITQSIENVPDNEKIDRLLQILYGHEMSDMVLIFVETKKMAEEVNRRLHREGIQSTTIHGDRRQQEREAALEDFKQKITPILVATDVASRGLDIPDVAHVVQFDLPQELDDYTHRIGRTGRAGNKGIATAFYNRNNRRMALDLHKYFSEHGQEIPKWFQQEAELVEGEALLGLDGGGGGRRRGGGGGGRGGGGGGGGGRGGGRGGGTWGETRSNIPTVPSRRRAGPDDGGF